MSGPSTRGSAKAVPGDDKEYGELKKLLGSLSAKMDSRFDKLTQQITSVRDDLLKQLEEKVQEVRDEFTAELRILAERVDSLETARAQPDHSTADIGDVRAVIDFAPETTVVAIGVPGAHDEDLEAIVGRMMEDMDLDTSEVVRVHRLRSRNEKPGIVKVQFTSTEHKVGALKAKKKLAESTEFRRTYLRSSKSHVERLVDINFRTILREIPGGDQYRLTGSGRVIKKTRQEVPHRGEVMSPSHDQTQPFPSSSRTPSPAGRPTPPDRPRHRQRLSEAASPGQSTSVTSPI